MMPSPPPAYLHIEAQLLPLLGHHLRQLVHAELLSELVVHTHLTPRSWVLDGQLKALDLEVHKHTQRMGPAWVSSTMALHTHACTPACTQKGVWMDGCRYR